MAEDDSHVNVRVPLHGDANESEEEKVRRWRAQLALEEEEEEAAAAAALDGSHEGAKELMKKYGLVEEGQDGGGGDEEAPPAFQGDFDWGQFNAEMQQRNSALVAELDEKTQEIERLEELLLAVEPIPGLEPERLLDLMQEGELVDKDPRDMKIVELAKKARALNVSLQKERQKVGRLKAALAEAQGPSGSAGAGAGSPKGKAKAASDGAEAAGGEEELIANMEVKIRNLKDKLKAARSRAENARMRYEKTEAELKIAHRALQREVGDAVPLERVLSEAAGRGDGGASPGAGKKSGWRGRAQKIVMLKARVTELEERLRQAEGEGRAPSPITVASSAAGSPSKRGKKGDVDSKARADLANMAQARAAAIERLEVEVEELREQNEEGKRQLHAAKARVRVLEKESNRGKANVKELLSKTETDNKLIDALRKKVAALQQQLQQVKMDRETAVQELTSSVTGPGMTMGGVSSMGPRAIGAMMEADRGSRMSPRSTATSPKGSASMWGGASSVAGASVASAVSSAVVSENNRLSRVVSDQARRIEQQDQIISSLKQQIAELRKRQMATGIQRPSSRPTSAEIRKQAQREVDAEEWEHERRSLLLENAQLKAQLSSRR